MNVGFSVKRESTPAAGFSQDQSITGAVGPAARRLAPLQAKITFPA